MIGEQAGLGAGGGGGGGGLRCGTCPVEEKARCLGLEVRTVVDQPGRLCELAAIDGRYAIELKRRAGESGLPPGRR